jgi:uncharacterized protein YjiS (DUF1127 family)
MRAQTHIRTEREARPATETWARIDPIVYVTAARRLQAQAMSEAIGAGWRGVRRGLAGLASLLQGHLLEPIARRSQRQRALAELAAMDDRLLADIGLQRGNIALAVDGRLADPGVVRRTSAAVQDRLLQGERHPTPPVTANSNRPGAPLHPDRAPDLAA